MTYTPYLVSNNYQCKSAVENTVTAEVTATVQMGFSGGGKLTASEAKEFNLGVSASVSASVSGSFSSKMTIPGWTAKGVRAYVKWTEHKYKGYRHVRYDLSGDHIIRETSFWEYATNKSLRNTGVKYWEVTNKLKSTTAAMPNPPIGWDG